MNVLLFGLFWAGYIAHIIHGQKLTEKEREEDFD